MGKLLSILDVHGRILILDILSQPDAALVYRCRNKSSELEALVDALPEVDSESKRWPPIDRDAVLFLVDLMQWLRLFLHARAFQGLTQIVRQLALVVASLAKSVFTTKHVEHLVRKSVFFRACI